MTPLNECFGDVLRIYILEYLDRNKVANTNLLKFAEIEKIKNDWIENKSFNVNKLWLLLIFMMWYEKWLAYYWQNNINFKELI